MAALVPVENVLRLANPLECWPWDGRPSAIDGGRCVTLQDVMVSDPRDLPWDRWTDVEPDTREDGEAHLGRIRFLMENGWADAIELDVGCPVLGYDGPSWPVLDGNHRLAAAALRGDKVILVSVAGQVDHAAKLLGVSEASLTEDSVEDECGPAN